jgi:hypothetical protein
MRRQAFNLVSKRKFHVSAWNHSITKQKKE